MPDYMARREDVAVPQSRTPVGHTVAPIEEATDPLLGRLFELLGRYNTAQNVLETASGEPLPQEYWDRDDAAVEAVEHLVVMIAGPYFIGKVHERG